MDNLYVELKGENQKLIQALRKLCDLYRVEVLDESLDCIETAEHMVLKVCSGKSEAVDLSILQDLAIEKVFFFKEITADDRFESEVVVKYYKRVNVVDSSMIKHKDSNAEIEHLSSGLTVKCQAHRSRQKNKREALNYLYSKLNAKNT